MGLDEDEDTMEDEDEGPPPLPPNHPPLIPTQDVSHFTIGGWGGGQGLSRYLETGCPNRGFIDFCVSKVWYKKHTTNKIDPIPLQILLF